MNFPSLLQSIPKIASVLGGLALVIGIPIIGFTLLTGSAIFNLISAVKQRKLGDICFFSAWGFFNCFFAGQDGGH